MAWNTVGKQWGYITAEFKEAVEAQEKYIAEKTSQGDAAGEYEEGWLAAFEMGFRQAQAKHQATWFAFWNTPDDSKDAVFKDFLNHLREEVELQEPQDTSYRTGMMDALDSMADTTDSYR